MRFFKAMPLKAAPMLGFAIFPYGKARLLESISKQRENLFGMVFRVHRIDDVCDLALLIDDECHAVGDADDGLRSR